MKRPSILAALNNQYERGQVELCGLFSITVKDAGVSQWHHIQGEINAIHISTTLKNVCYNKC